MLDRAGDADGDIELGRDDLAGLADLLVVGHIARVDRGARRRRRAAPSLSASGVRISLNLSLEPSARSNTLNEVRGEDLRYASREKAFFGQPEVGSGVIPGGGGSERLPRLIGRDRALEVILSSEDYDAEIADHYGWVTRTVADKDLDSFVDAMASRLASFDKTALAAAKMQINRATLPPDADLQAAYTEFLASLSFPGFKPRAANF